MIALPTMLSRALVRRLSSVVTGFSALLAFCCALCAFSVVASEYTVSPMRMELDRDARSTVLTLTNIGTDRIEFQLRASEWTQDAQGRDRYSDTGELVFFPKILSLEPNDSRVVRIGIKSVPVSVERTFRLFIEKIPSPNPEPPPPGAHVAVNVRFALPIFVKPPVHEAKGELAGAAIARSELAFVLKNTGNEHFRMDDGITIIGRDGQGGVVFSRKLDDRYVLAGVAKRYVATIPQETCRQTAALEVTAKSELFTLSRRLDVNRTDCE